MNLTPEEAWKLIDLHTDTAFVHIERVDCYNLPNPQKILARLNGALEAIQRARSILLENLPTNASS